jgi:hypothetical protein
LAWRDANPNDSIYWEKLIKNNGSPLPSAPARCQRRREGDQRWWTTGAAAVAAVLSAVTLSSWNGNEPISTIVNLYLFSISISSLIYLYT